VNDFASQIDRGQTNYFARLEFSDKFDLPIAKNYILALRPLHSVYNWTQIHMLVTDWSSLFPFVPHFSS
jgi:hypothetical protein